MDHTVHNQVEAVNFFDTTIDVKKYACSLNKNPANIIEPYVNLYININDVCQANCAFCEFHKDTKRKFDIHKLYKVLKELDDRNIAINKINISGGEPMINSDIVEKVLRFIPDGVYKTINTNGFNWQKTIQLSEHVDCISLSRHHYDDDVNESIFGTVVPGLKAINDFPDKRKLHLRCNMIKGFIDSQKSAETYIDVLSLAGVMDYGFVSLMPLNNFCRDNFINHEILDWENTGRTHTAYTQERTGICSCKNFLYYTKNGDLVKMYTRINEDITYEASNLVFDIDTLKQGFNGRVIL